MPARIINCAALSPSAPCVSPAHAPALPVDAPVAQRIPWPAILTRPPSASIAWCAATAAKKPLAPKIRYAAAPVARLLVPTAHLAAPILSAAATTALSTFRAALHQAAPGVFAQPASSPARNAVAPTAQRIP